ncbi:MAG: hypothetical protein PF636_06115 [Actinomycetota bacterium]|jgi:hypothetical protein|nr:hypothetical protein [Actinomycetota bacterium]
MTVSNCTKCDGTVFEAAELTIEGVDRVLLAIHCAGCGGVVSVVEKRDIASMIHQQNRGLIFVGQQFGMKLGLDTE